MAKESHIVNALISAAKNGKNVKAFVELKARFDEANNVKWSRIMKKAGVQLIYSDPSVKVHSKLGLVKKKNGECYGVVTTGNFNETTAAFYTDHVLFTANKEVCEEIDTLFTLLSKKKQDFEKAAGKVDFKQLYVAPLNLLSEFERLIDEEIAKAQNGQPALLRFKVNILEEPYFINLLYKASQQGVKVQMIVRSICCLIPGKEGLSENIEVRRIVSQYLEHSRLFIFGAGPHEKVIMGSSDLMTRNLRRRVEVCLEVTDPSARQQLLDYFSIQWADNTKAVRLDENMDQHSITPASDKRYNAQADIRKYLQHII